MEKTCINGDCNNIGDCICKQNEIDGYWKDGEENKNCDVCKDNYYPNISKCTNSDLLQKKLVKIIIMIGMKLVHNFVIHL